MVPIPTVVDGGEDATGISDRGTLKISPDHFNPEKVGLQPEATDLEGTENQLTVVSYNLLNLDPNDNDGNTDVADGHFDAIPQPIVNHSLIISKRQISLVDRKFRGTSQLFQQT
jgi:hypothetical protein